MLYTPKRIHTITKYKKIQERYNQLYNVERRRRDDCKVIVEREFFIDRRTLNRVINSDLETLPEQPDPYTNQMDMFKM